MENATINKIDDSTIEVIKNAPVLEPVRTTYSIDFLKSQELSILKSMNDFVTQRQVELEEVRVLITEAENLGLKTKEVLQAEQIELEAERLEAIKPIEKILEVKI